MAKVAGLRPLALFDDGRAREVYPLAVEQGVTFGKALARTRPSARCADTDPAA